MVAARPGKEEYEPMQNPRKPVAMLAMLAWLVIYVVAVGSLSGQIGALSGWLQMPLYILAGTLWILPLKPLFAWMNAVEPPEED